RVCGRAVAMIDVDSEYFSKQVVQILSSIARVIRGSSIAHSNVQKPVGSKADHTSIMICERLGDHQQGRLAGIGEIRIAFEGSILGDHRGTVGISSVVHEETPIVLKVRVE